MSRASTIIATVAAAALVAFTMTLQAVGPFPLTAIPTPVLIVGAVQAVMVPISVIGVGLGALPLIREGHNAGRLALIGVIGNAAYLFLLSTLLALTVTAG